MTDGQAEAKSDDRLTFINKLLKYTYMAKNLTDGRIKEKDRLFKSQLKKLTTFKTTQPNKNKIKNFIRDKELIGVTKTSITPYLAAVIRLLENYNKNFNKITEENLKTYFSKMQNTNSERGTPYSPSSIWMHKRHIKFFYKWLNGGEIFPNKVKWIKNNSKRTTVETEDLLSPKDVETLIRNTDNTRDQAIISVLYDSATRADEFCNVRIKDVVFDQLGALMRVTGKTGTRKVRLINSVPYLQAWLQVHPFRDKENSFFWYNTKGKKWAQVNRQTLSRIIERAVTRAGDERRIYPHLFRHSRLTELAPKIPEQALKAFAGWGQDSRMAAIYIHMNGKNLDDALAKAHGIQISEEQQENELVPKTCPRCKTSNTPTSKYCSTCSMVLDQKTAIFLDQIKHKDDLTVKAMTEKLTLMQQSMTDIFEEIETMRKTP